MKRFLVAIIVILMSTVAFASDPRESVDLDSLDAETAEMAAKASLEATVTAITDAARLFPNEKQAEVILALADLHDGIYAVVTGGGCVAISNDWDRLSSYADKLPPQGGGSCYGGFCTTLPPGPGAVCSWDWFWYYCAEMACCGTTGYYPVGSGMPCGWCIGWPW